MSMSLANADTYIARIIGGANDTNVKAQARDALGAAMEEWMHRNDWKFLLLDTSQSFSVASCTIAANGTDVSVGSSGFKNVLKNMTVSGTGVTAGTLVSSVTSTTAIVLDTAATPATVSLTFGGTIPIIDGTDTYTLPAKFLRPHSCRLVSAVKRPLSYITQYDYDAMSWDQTLEGYVGAYTIYNSVAFDSNGTQQTKIRFFRVPSQNDVALLRYYRMMDLTDDPVDVPDQYLYTLLDLARVKLLLAKNATDARIPALTRDVEIRTMRAIAHDAGEGGRDQMEGFRTPSEISIGSQGPPFFPHGDVVWRGDW